jgi:ribosomal-protein-alanine N-acetyltransferase
LIFRRQRSPEGEFPWPVRLEGRTPGGELVSLRPLRADDEQEYLSVRRGNHEWLAPWDATSPRTNRPTRTFAELVEAQGEDARAGRALPLVIDHGGFVPTAVALIGDHCVSEMQLHRIEINIRPENVASLAVVRKLGFRDEGLRPRYLHIDGDWRDHQSFALTVEDLGDSTLMERLAQSSQPSLWRHTDGGPPA